MRHRAIGFLALIAMLALLAPAPLLAAKGDHSSASKEESDDSSNGNSSKKKEKPFKEMIKDRVVIEGLFTFYHDTVDNTMLMAITPEQMGPIYLWGNTRSKAEGNFYDNGSMGRTFPFYIQRIGKKILFLEKNLRIRADSSNAMFGAVQAGISDALRGSMAIKSKPEKDSKAVLIDPTSLFVRDAGNTGFFLGERGKTGFSFDSKNSHFSDIKSFPENTEISVKLHFKSSRPASGTTMQSSYSFFHTYHYSLSTLPETGYVPRFGDERVGYFFTMYQDYNQLDTETPYVRLIDRWQLVKKDSSARISEPVNPIVYWIENTTPPEFRDAIAEGIEFWNPAFEKIGFRNAMVAKQMPDDAEWDPADVRYSTVRWMVQPGGGYAVGPHRANPFTGQVYDADIRISSDFMRFMFLIADMWLTPLSFDGSVQGHPEQFEELPHSYEQDNFNPYQCTYGVESAQEAAFGLAYLTASTGDFADKSELTKEYVHAYLVELVAHEVGHTIGLRHNFKASTIHSLEEISDRDFTRQNGVTGSVMDYGPPNIPLEGMPQGEFFNSRPGPYDNWAIEYGYSEFGGSTPEDDKEELLKIASRSGEPYLAYATDENAFGRSMKSIDPLVNLHDMGDDPLAYAKHQINLTRKIWRGKISNFEKPGTRYQKILRVFQIGWRSFRTAAQIAPKYIGGIYHTRGRVGDPGITKPFTPVSAAKQREAMQFLSDYVFAPDAFDIDPDLLNKLQSENLQDFSFSAFSRAQVDYPYHQQVMNIQNLALFNLYSPFVLGRLLNNLNRVDETADKYTMHDLFTETRRAIWTEIVGPNNVNSFRRQLQLIHLARITNIYLSAPNRFPSDARTLAARDLDILETAAQKATRSSAINPMTKAHFNEVIRQIEAARKAQRNYSFR